MAYIGIYNIKNKKSGKFYLGSSINIERRFGRHMNDLRKNKHDNVYLQRAWNKYGEKSFEFLINRECSSIDLLNEEQKDLDMWVGNPDCYNLSKIAGQPIAPGQVRSEEVKRKISLAQKGKPRWSDEEKQQMSVNRQGRKHTQGTIEKFKNRSKSSYSGIIKAQEFNSGRIYSRNHMSNISSGKLKNKKILTEEEKQKIRNGVKASYKNGKCKKHKVPKEEYDTIKSLYLSGNINKRQLAFRYGINPSSMQKLLHRIGI
jgi:group I intron endonuclease